MGGDEISNFPASYKEHSASGGAIEWLIADRFWE